MAKRQIEIPVHNNKNVTSRSLKEDHPNNQNLYLSSKEFQDLLKEVKIRFDTNPKFYLREDFLKLIELIKKKSGSSDLTVEIVGSGNVVTDVSYDNGILTITKGEISGGSKEYFPDYAFWQKPGAKKGALVLWNSLSPIFGYNKNPRDFRIEVGDFEIKSSWDEDDRWYYSGQISLKTLISLLNRLKENNLIGSDSEVSLKFGLLNAVHCRIDDFPAWLITIGNIIYPLETKEIEWDDHEYDNYYFTELKANIPVEDLLLFSDVANCTISGLIDLPDSCDAKKKLRSFSTIKVYTTVWDYFNKYCKKSDQKFCILQYYKTDDLWKLTEISQREVKVKYHKTMASINGTSIERKTYRQYLAGFIKAYHDRILFSDLKKGIIKFPLVYPEIEEEIDGEIVSHRQPLSFPNGSFLVKRRVYTHQHGRKYLWTFKGVRWGNRRPTCGFNSYRFVGIYPSVKSNIGKCRTYLFYCRGEHELRTKWKKPFIWFKMPIFRVYENGRIAFAYYLDPKIMY